VAAVWCWSIFTTRQQGILRLVNLSSIQKQGYLLHFLADQILFQLSL